LPAPGAITYAFGGDEFVVLLDDMAHAASDAELVPSRSLDGLHLPITVSNSARLNS